ncbi:MAG: hypothetical protein R3C61_03265 [Bacteroidia bacterium]
MTEAFESADLVFEGKVVFINTNWMAGGLKYSFEITRTWKRPAAKYLIVNTPWEKDCGYSFKADSSYIVFVNKKFGLKTDGCMGNVSVSGLSAETSLPKDFFLPENNNTDKMVYFLAYSLGIAVFLSIAFIALVVLRKKWHQPRRN